MRLFAALIATILLGSFATQELCAYPLTLEQRERLGRYLPRSFPKLEARDPVHIVAMGDSVMSGYNPLKKSAENNNPLFAYTGVFLDRLAREFFYPGSVRLVNPPEKGPDKLTDRLGDELTLENLCDGAGNMLTGLRHATTDAYLHGPDLILVNYGINDAFEYISIDTYKRALQEIIDTAKQQNVDIIVLGPTIVRYGGGAMEWGVTRPYSMAAEEVASANGVLFIDSGKHLAKFGGGIDPATHPLAAMEIVGDRFGRIFYYGPDLKSPERVHPSPQAHLSLGEAMFDDLLNGPRKTNFTYTGAAAYAEDGKVNVSMVIRNQSGDSFEGSIGALSVGSGLIPGDKAQRYTIASNGTTQVNFGYQRPVVGKTSDGSDNYFFLSPSDPMGRFGFALEDTFTSDLVDLPVRIGPVTAVWTSRQFINVSNEMRVEWDLVNGTDKALSGTFQVGMADKIGQPTSFSVSPLGTKSVFSLFQFDPSDRRSQFQQDIWIQLDVDGKVVRFTREMEASRDLVLGQPMPMKTWAEYVDVAPTTANPVAIRRTEKPAVSFEADENALYVITQLDGVSIPDLGDDAALRARIFLDARPVNEVRSFGVVAPVEVYTLGADGRGTTPTVPLGCFGNGYNMILRPEGISSVLETEPSGTRRLTVRVPRKYFHRHEWELDSIDSVLGVRLELTVADPSGSPRDRFPNKNTYVTNSPSFSWEEKIIHGFHETDARSLMTLRLFRQPVESWSVRLY